MVIISVREGEMAKERDTFCVFKFNVLKTLFRRAAFNSRRIIRWCCESQHLRSIAGCGWILLNYKLLSSSCGTMRHNSTSKNSFNWILLHLFIFYFIQIFEKCSTHTRSARITSEPISRVKKQPNRSIAHVIYVKSVVNYFFRSRHCFRAHSKRTQRKTSASSSFISFYVSTIYEKSLYPPFSGDKTSDSIQREWPENGSGRLTESVLNRSDIPNIIW